MSEAGPLSDKPNISLDQNEVSFPLYTQLASQVKQQVQIQEMHSQQLSELRESLNLQMSCQQEALQKIFESLSIKDKEIPNDFPVTPPHGIHEGENGDHLRSTSNRPMSSKMSIQAVNLLSSQLPEFGGNEVEDVDQWIQKIEDIADIHEVSNEVTLLSASTKMTKNARRWFDLSSIRRSWFEFKSAITKRFKRKILFHVQIQKVEARRWNSYKETFQDYAMDKIALMHSLHLQDEDIIQLIINEMNSAVLRGTATALNSDSVDDFLQKMHSISVSFADSIKMNSHSPRFDRKFKGSTENLKIEKSKSIAVDTSEPKQSTTSKNLFCVYCKLKGIVIVEQSASN